MRSLSAFLVLGLGVVVACGSPNDSGLKGGSGGGTSGGGTSSGGATSGGSSSGGAAGSSGGATSGGAPSGGGAPAGGSTSGGAPAGGATSGGGAPSGGGMPGGGGAPSGGGGMPGGGGAPTAFCAGHCGSGSPQPGPAGNCYCDTDCVSKGDCCPDYSKTCGTGMVACDGNLCDRSAKQFCCHNYNGGWSSSCAADGKVCSGSSYCDGPEDCEGGKVCCGKVNTTYNYFSNMSCQAAAGCNYDQNYRVICGPSKQCPSGFVCKPSGSPTGYWYCGKPV